MDFLVYMLFVVITNSRVGVLGVRVFNLGLCFLILFILGIGLIVSCNICSSVCVLGDCEGPLLSP